MTATEKWLWTFTAGSNDSGAGSFTIKSSASGPDATSVRGSINHLDDGPKQDERLKLTAYRLVSFRYSRAFPPRHEVQLGVRVLSSNHPKRCPFGARGTLSLTLGDADTVRLRICGREHNHLYVDRAKFRVKVTIEAIEHEGPPQPILTVNGETARATGTSDTRRGSSPSSTERG